MSFAYIRRYYRVHAKRLGRVRVDGREGTIIGCRSQYVLIRLDGAKCAFPYHPTDGIEYLQAKQAQP